MRKPRPWAQNHIIKRNLHNVDPVCYWCNVPMNYSQATLEHLIPKSQGGKLEKENIRLACRECNQQRKTLPASEFVNSEYLHRKRAEVGSLPQEAWNIPRSKTTEQVNLEKETVQRNKHLNFQVLYFKNQILV